MNALEKTAAFLVLLGLERGRHVLDFMDSDEINTVVETIGKLPPLTPALQEALLAELVERGYEADMHPFDLLQVLRSLFQGGKISERSLRWPGGSLLHGGRNSDDEDE